MFSIFLNGWILSRDRLLVCVSVCVRVCVCVRARACMYVCEYVCVCVLGLELVDEFTFCVWSLRT